MWSVSRRIGPQAARRLFLLGADLSAPEAFETGLCDALAEEGDAETRALALVLDLARSAPETRNAVRAFFADAPTTLDEALAIEAGTQPRLYRSRDLAEGIAAFREKRPPRWSGR
jgi:enoyl-CoA hydratase/carnithine racemase